MRRQGGRQGGGVRGEGGGISSCLMDHLSSETAGHGRHLTGPQCGGPHEDRTRQ